MAQLPIRRLTLWKQGFGYFERRGVITERTISLVVPRNATNDVLKSLNIVVHAGGQVLSVDYETPEDKAQVLRNLAVKLADRSSLVDLLISLRGSHVTLSLDDDRTVSGRLIGVEASIDEAPVVTLIGGDERDNQLQIFPVKHLQGVTLLDDRSAQDVGFFLDVSQVEQTRTTLTVRVSEGEHDLEISYLAPSPVWRVSYRLVATADGNAMLTAWGIFENSMEEDLDDVSLTLISGRPISFVYDLYESSIPPRPQVSDDSTIKQQMSSDPRVAETISGISHDLRSPLSSIMGYAELLSMEGELTQDQQQFVQALKESAERMRSMMDTMLSAMNMRDEGNRFDNTATNSYRTSPLGDLKVSGRYFVPVMMSNADSENMTYRVDNPISVKRGQSAMVPILNATLAYRELVVYNGTKLPNHPLIVWELANTTGFTLEQGPVTVVNEGYAGEALLRFTGVEDNIQVPFALEFGILVEERTKRDTQQLHSLHFDADKQRVIVRRAQITTHTFTLISRVERDVTVLIEHRDPDSSKGEYYEMPDATDADAGHTRWAVDVPAKSETDYAIRVRNFTEGAQDIRQWSREFITDAQEAGLIDDRRLSLLSNLLDSKTTVTESTQEIKALQAEQERIQTLQEQLRKNLSALGDSEREASIRDSILNDLENSENRRRETQDRINQLESIIEEAKDAQTRLVNDIFVE